MTTAGSGAAESTGEREMNLLAWSFILDGPILLHDHYLIEQMAQFNRVGNNTPVFFIRDPMKFQHFIRFTPVTPGSPGSEIPLPQLARGIPRDYIYRVVGEQSPTKGGVMDNRPYGAGALASLFLLALASLLPPPAYPAPTAQPVAQVVQPAQPEWNEQNPCPECAQEKQFADYFADRLARLDLEAQVTREALDANTRKLLQTQHRIDDIDTRLDNERGEGGESYDPHTGITVRSYTESDGKVRMDTIGPDDRLMDSVSYPRLSTRELREERIICVAEVRATKEEGARLRSQLDAATGMRDKAIADLEQARRALQECIAVRCR